MQLMPQDKIQRGKQTKTVHDTVSGEKPVRSLPVGENEPLTIMHLDLKSREAKSWGAASVQNLLQYQLIKKKKAV